MLKYKISEIISNIDEEYICEATDYVRVKSRRFLNWIKGKVWILGLVVLIVLGVKFIPVLLGNIFEKEPEKLVICTDWSTYDEVKGSVRRWKTFSRKYSTIQTEIIRIPSDKVAAEIKIQELRTEIMAGKGPDLFIMESNEPYFYDTDYHGEIHMLFPNPEKAMYSDIFLPLDDYLKDAEFIQTQYCNQAVLKAGQTEEGQLLLPIIYEYMVCVFPDYESEGLTKFPDSWEEIVSSKSMQAALRSQTYKGLPQAFGKLADFKDETILVSEDDLVKEVKRACSFQKTWNDVKAFQVDIYDFLSALGISNKIQSFYPIPNVDGGVTACISVYAGINQNTQVSEEAFSLLDTFCEITKINNYFPTRGIFIADDELVKKFYRLNYGLQEEDVRSFLEMNEMITTARFYSSWDTKLADIYEKHWDKDAPTAEEAVSELYNDMLMQIKE